MNAQFRRGCLLTDIIYQDDLTQKWPLVAIAILKNIDQNLTLAAKHERPMIKEITLPQYKFSCDMCKKSAIAEGRDKALDEQGNMFIPLGITIPNSETNSNLPYVSVNVDLCRDCWNEFKNSFLQKLQAKI